MSDHFNKRLLLFLGMLLQGIALVFVAFASEFIHFVALSVVLWWGTAMVYPTFLSAIAEYTHPQDRAKSLGVFRLWRDLGYAIGAILTGIVADLFSIPASIVLVAVLTIFSALVIRFRMSDRQ